MQTIRTSEQDSISVVQRLLGVKHGKIRTKQWSLLPPRSRVKRSMLPVRSSATWICPASARAELPTTLPARRRHGGCSSPFGSSNVIGGNRRAAPLQHAGPAAAYTRDVSPTLYGPALQSTDAVQTIILTDKWQFRHPASKTYLLFPAVDGRGLHCLDSPLQDELASLRQPGWR
jgi:hypothetical protein